MAQARHAEITTMTYWRTALSSPLSRDSLDSMMKPTHNSMHVLLTRSLDTFLYKKR